MSIAEICNKMYGKTIRECSNEQVYTALLHWYRKSRKKEKKRRSGRKKKTARKCITFPQNF